MYYAALVENNLTTAELLRDYLSADEIRITCHYASGEEALEQIPLQPLPDVVLMDIGLPGVSGVEVTRQLKTAYPDLDIVMLTTFEDPETILEAIKAGASGYVLKASPREEIQQAVCVAKQGGSFLSGKVARLVLNSFQQAPRRSPDEDRWGLTEREREILDRLVDGAPYKAIADQLCISVHTVNNHIRHIYEKLQVSSRGAAVARVIGGKGAG